MAMHPIHKPQLLSCMQSMDIPIGLIVNFDETLLTNGVSRIILPGRMHNRSIEQKIAKVAKDLDKGCS